MTRLEGFVSFFFQYRNGGLEAGQAGCRNRFWSKGSDVPGGGSQADVNLDVESSPIVSLMRWRNGRAVL